MSERQIKEFSVCSADGDVLVTSMEVPGTEWLCMTCGARFPMFVPSAAVATPERFARWDALREAYRRGERRMAAAS